jgi:hypothetical protein
MDFILTFSAGQIKNPILINIDGILYYLKLNPQETFYQLLIMNSYFQTQSMDKPNIKYIDTALFGSFLQ